MDSENDRKWIYRFNKWISSSPVKRAVFWVIVTIAFYIVFLVIWFLSKDWLLSTVWGKSFETFAAEPWKYIALAEGALITLGTALWRGLLHDKQTQEQIEQGKRTEKQIANTAEQIKLSRETLAETQTNNLAKLFTDATKLLGAETTEAEQSAGLSLLELVAFGAEGRFLKAVTDILREFVYAGAKENLYPIDGKSFRISDEKGQSLIKALHLIDDIYESLSDKQRNEYQSLVNMEDINIISGVHDPDPRSYRYSYKKLKSFKHIKNLTYIKIMFCQENFTKIPVSSYIGCYFLDCVITDSMKIYGSDIGKFSYGNGEDEPENIKSYIYGLTLREHLSFEPDMSDEESPDDKFDDYFFINSCMDIKHSIFKASKNEIPFSLFGESIKTENCYYDSEFIKDKESIEFYKQHGIQPYPAL